MKFLILSHEGNELARFDTAKEADREVDRLVDVFLEEAGVEPDQSGPLVPFYCIEVSR